MKKSTIILIFKQGNRDEMANYRPISILPFFSLSKLWKKYCTVVSIAIYLKPIACILPNMDFERGILLQWQLLICMTK